MQPTQAKDFTLDTEILAVSLDCQRELEGGIARRQRDTPAIHNASSEDAAQRLAETVAVIEAQKAKWQLPPGCRVVVLYEAGQDGFWICRALSKLGYETLVVDPASIPVERHARRAKTDRLDAIKLVTSLRAWLRGERDRMHVIRIPTPDAEAQRHLARDRANCRKKRGNTGTGSANYCAQSAVGIASKGILPSACNAALSDAMTARHCRRNSFSDCSGNVNGWRWRNSNWRGWKKTWSGSYLSPCRNASWR